MANAALDLILTKLADEIKPNEKFINDGMETVSKVYDLLLAYSEYCLVKFVVLGSVGKNTAIFEPSFDCLVYIHGNFPKRKRYVDILEKFKEVLLSSGHKMGLHITDIVIDKPNFRLSANGFRMQFALTRESCSTIVHGNFALTAVHESRVSPLEAQFESNQLVYFVRNMAVKCLHKNDEDREYCNCEFILRFLRVVKLWYQPFLKHHGWATGCKETIDITSIYLVKKYIGKEKGFLASVSKMFEGFLRALMDFENLKVIPPSYGMMDRLDEIPSELSRPVRLQLLAKMLGLPPDLMKQKPLVVDNYSYPHRNAVQVFWDSTKIRKIKKYAADTLKRLKDCPADCPVLENVFGAQEEFFDLKIFGDFAKWLVSIRKCEDVFRWSCDVRNAERFSAKVCKKGKFENLVGFLRLMIFVYLSEESVLFSGDVVSKLANKCRYFVDHYVRGATDHPTEWANAEDCDHDSFDVTIEIPFGVNNVNYVAKISFI